MSDMSPTERQGKPAGKSRSELDPEALPEHLTRSAPEEVTEGMNDVIERLGDAETDRFVTTAGRKVLARTEW